MIKTIFSNSHTWVVIAAFVIGGLTFIAHFLPGDIGGPLLSICGIIAVALNVNQQPASGVKS